MTKAILFPIYRKYKNRNVFFKINSFTQWEEIQQVGSKKLHHIFEVKILPDRNFINDMIFDYTHNWDKISEAAYIHFFNS
jgi:hypothetical protein